MKNKIFTFILAIFLLLPGIILLTACKPKQYSISAITCEGGSIKASLDGSGDQAKQITKAEAGVTIFLYSFADEGFEFDHYIVDGNVNSTGYFTMPNKDITISAVFNNSQQQEIKVQIDYHTDQWTVNPNPTEVPLNEDFVLQNPTKPGYTFIGWSDRDSLDNVIIPGQTISFTFPRETVNYYPKFEANFNLSNDGTAISSLSIYAGLNLTEIIIPNSIDGKNITAIGEGAIRHDHITSFRFGKNIKNIGADAFKNTMKIDAVYYDGNLNDWLDINFANSSSSPLLCNLGSGDYKSTNTEFYLNNSKLENLTLSAETKSVKANTFRGFTFIENFYFEGTLDQYLKVQFANSFSNPALYGKLHINGEIPRGLMEITSNINYIQPAAFYNCKEISRVILPSTVKFIGTDAFAYCSGIMQINLEKVVNIYDYAFYSCSKLSQISLDLIQLIGDKAFLLCEKLSTASFGNGISEIGEQAFSVTSLTEVSLKNASHINRIGLGAFALSKLTLVELPSSVDKIEEQAFRGLDCDNFTITEYVDEFDIDALYEARILHLTIESVKVYNAIYALPRSTPRLQTIKVAKSIVDENPQNSFLHNSSQFTKVLNGDYYEFTKVR